MSAQFQCRAGGLVFNKGSGVCVMYTQSTTAWTYVLYLIHFVLLPSLFATTALGKDHIRTLIN